MTVFPAFSDVGTALVEMALLLMVSGCASTKWAMDDDRYALAHSSPYSADPVQRRQEKCRESIDARFQAGNSGVYVGGAGNGGRWPAALGELGAFWMPSAWTTTRLGIIGIDDNGTGAGGVVAGARIHAPTRLTPYLGVSSTLAYTGQQTGSPRYSSGSARQGLRRSAVEGLFAVVPEAGLSYWITPNARLNVGASYYVTDSGRPDFLLYGVSMEFSTRPPLPPCDPPGLDYSTFPEPGDPAAWVPTASNCGTYVLPDGSGASQVLSSASTEPPTPDNSPRALSTFDLPEMISSTSNAFSEAPTTEKNTQPQ